MGKKKQRKDGVWSDRRRFLMTALSNLLLGLFVLALGKGWDRYQPSPPLAPRDTQITPKTGSLHTSSGKASLPLEVSASRTSSNSVTNSIGFSTSTDSQSAVIIPRR
jgi:hypothetical protein